MNTKLQAYAGAHDGTGVIRKPKPVVDKVDHSKGGGSKPAAWFTREQIDAHQRHLTRPHHAVLVASLTEDYDAMAVSLHIAVGTAKSRLHRARRALAALVTPIEIELVAPEQVGAE